MTFSPSTEIRTLGYVIRLLRWSDTSLIVEWLTEQEGRVTTIARGAMRPKSPLAGKLDLLFFAAVFYQRRRNSDLHFLREVDLRSTPKRSRRSPNRLKRLAYFVELIRRATETETPIPEIFRLFGQTMDLTETGPDGRVPILWFEWRLLGLLGSQPAEHEGSLKAGRELLAQWNAEPDPPLQPVPDRAAQAIAPRLAAIWHEISGGCPRSRSQLLP